MLDIMGDIVSVLIFFDFLINNIDLGVYRKGFRVFNGVLQVRWYREGNGYI